MKIFFKTIRPLFILLAVVTVGNSVSAADWTKVTVISGQTRHVFSVELAISPEEQTRGLMYRDFLAPNEGMVFIYKKASPRSFWMRNVPIALDIIFIGLDGHIINVVANAEPQTDTPRASASPALMVLELMGGRAAELGIQAGDLVDHPAIKLAQKRAAATK